MDGEGDEGYEPAGARRLRFAIAQVAGAASDSDLTSWADTAAKACYAAERLQHGRLRAVCLLGCLTEPHCSLETERHNVLRPPLEPEGGGQVGGGDSAIVLVVSAATLWCVCV